MKITISVNDNDESLNNFEKYTVSDFYWLHNIIMAVNYSAGLFKDATRNNRNWFAQELIIFDFDGFITMDAIKRAFKDYQYLIITTKSHNKLKNGIVAERFRLVLTGAIYADDFCAENYSIAYKYLAEKYHADTACSDVARFYWRSPKDAVYFYNDGKEFDLKKYFILGINEINAKKEASNKNKIDYPASHESFMNKDNWFNMFKPEQIADGGRNNAIAKIIFWAIDNKCSEAQCLEIAHWVNDRIPNPLGDLELEKIVLTKF